MLRRRSKDRITYTDILLARDEEEAEIKLRKYVSSNPTDIAAYVRLGDILRGRRMLEEAVRIHRSLLKPRLDSRIKKRVLQSVIDDLFAAEKFKESLPYLKEIVALFPRDGYYLNMLAGVCEQSEMWEDAIATRKKLGDKETLACVFASYGRALFKKGFKREAIQKLNMALRMDAASVPALLYMGDIKYDSGDIDEAIELWRRIIRDASKFAFITFSRLENAYFEKRRYQDMVDIYESCIEVSESMEAHRRLAELYYKLGEKEKAADMLLKAFEMSRDERTAYQLVELYKKEKDYKRAVEVMEDVLGKVAKGNAYMCSKCGGEFKEFCFRCERCFEWMTLQEKIER
ncbi:hypothetical protein CH333_10215 [candidate division WOR-3 bacterium JGI_Cruoil_03_44_89]|uniref:Uncharacterized protein n=1 Tax=candidate division WOR-3 bacterium JGI_Cruoil_03_44_89 TaxID=1973748 RepID=A0A235BP02_UNCW3|nr:MAG: hypothetical protein CH333_10215 [candidate division WOR-3 bacterium JGI_Cruoil_03_44_89]